MSKKSPLSAAARTAILALCILGLLGACLILGLDGFTSSSKRGDVVVFVPAPAAYLAAVPLLIMSILALLVLLRDFGAGIKSYLLWGSIYTLAAVAFGLSARTFV